jgi:hypothetical protein
MKALLKTMKMQKYKIPENKIPFFEDIIQRYEGQYGECDAKFFTAMEEHLTKEQRFRIFEQNGSCKGTGNDKERNEFARKHAHIPLAERLEIFAKISGRSIVLNDDNTITVTFACKHGYYKNVHEKKPLRALPPIRSYFERCAGGRLYELGKTLGIKLKIKSVDISSLKKNTTNPVVFTFEIVE